MKKIRVPIIIQDPETKIKAPRGKNPEKEILAEGHDPVRKKFSNGPESDKLVVMQIDPITKKWILGSLRYNPGKKRGWYENLDKVKLTKDNAEELLYSQAIMEVNVFSSALRAIDQIEKRDILGHPVNWAFSNEKLKLIPLAGNDANAYYQRASESIQFFYTPSKKDPDKNIYTCLSRDIVAHEVAHAIIDGIAPDLYDAITPQSLAIHEGLADIFAVFAAFASHNLRERVLKDNRGSIAEPNAFMFIAEELAHRKDRKGLRTLINRSHLNPSGPIEYYAPRNKKYALSAVLSGAIYKVIINLHLALREEGATEFPEKETEQERLFSASGGALDRVRTIIPRLVFRALDILPPGESTFLDFGRAMIAVDRTLSPSNSRVRDWITQEFVSRSVSPTPNILTRQSYLPQQTPTPQNVKLIMEDDLAARKFVEENRAWLGIPPSAKAQVRPRLHIVKEDHPNKVVEECILKVSFEIKEPNQVRGLPTERWVTYGSTAVFDMKTGEVRARLTNALPDILGVTPKDRSEAEYYQNESKLLREDRNNYLRALARARRLTPEMLTNPNSEQLLLANMQEGALKIRGTGNMLHLYGDEDDEIHS